VDFLAKYAVIFFRLPRMSGLGDSLMDGRSDLRRRGRADQDYVFFGLCWVGVIRYALPGVMTSPLFDPRRPGAYSFSLGYFDGND